MRKIIIAGSRKFNDYEELCRWLDLCLKKVAEPVEIVSGGAGGVDSLGEQYAEERGIPVRRFPAEWKKDGRSAGVRRNRRMGKYADALIAFWDGKSRGTKDMIEYMRHLNRHVQVIYFE